MSDNSSIEWTDATWNPVRGCTKISPGCKHCYAETFAERWRGTPGHAYEQGFDLRLVPEKLTEPLALVKSRKVFANSMSDLFHSGVSDRYVRLVFEAMAAADWHTFQVLTKRGERLRDMTRSALADLAALEHIWLGVSVEDRKYGLPRIDQLREAKAGRRFLSVEPLLEDLGEIDLTGIDWVICGGESGQVKTIRPMHIDWVRSIRDQCVSAGVPFLFKQWGAFTRGSRICHLMPEFAGQVRDFTVVEAIGSNLKPGDIIPVEVGPAGELTKLVRVGKKAAGREIDGRTWDGYPPIPVRSAPPRSERQRRSAHVRALAAGVPAQIRVRP